MEVFSSFSFSAPVPDNGNPPSAAPSDSFPAYDVFRSIADQEMGMSRVNLRGHPLLFDRYIVAFGCQYVKQDEHGFAYRSHFSPENARGNVDRTRRQAKSMTIGW